MTTTEFVILDDGTGWGDEEPTDAHLEEYARLLNASGYCPGEDWLDGEDEGPAEFSVRRTRSGEAGGVYYCRPSGDLQILGYSLDYPDGLEQVINEALAVLSDAAVAIIEGED
jgi:hypothetical protein